MCILRPKNCQRGTKLPISRFGINAKMASPKSKRLFHISISLSEIFRTGVKLSQDLIYRPGLLSKAFKNFGGQILNFDRQILEFG